MRRFTLTQDHIKLLRHANVRWEDCEFGAPAIDCKRPYGNGDVIRDVAKILGVGTVTCEDGEEHILAKDAEWLRLIHLETETALQVVLFTGMFEPGMYVADDYRNTWRRA